MGEERIADVWIWGCCNS